MDVWEGDEGGDLLSSALEVSARTIMWPWPSLGDGEDEALPLDEPLAMTSSDSVGWTSRGGGHNDPEHPSQPAGRIMTMVRLGAPMNVYEYRQVALAGPLCALAGLRWYE